MTETNTSQEIDTNVTTFEVPERFLGLNKITVRKEPVVSLTEKALNFVSVGRLNFSITDMCRGNRWTPCSLTINGHSRIVLLDARLIQMPEVLDLYITIMQRFVTLTATRNSETGEPHYRIEVDPGIRVDSRNARSYFIENSSFCDLLDDILIYDKTKFRSVHSLIRSFHSRLQGAIEKVVVAKYPELGPKPKNVSKTKSKTNSLKNTGDKEAPRTALAIALQSAQAK